METDSELSSHHVICELLSGLGLISVLLVSISDHQERNFLYNCKKFFYYKLILLKINN